MHRPIMTCRTGSMIFCASSESSPTNKLVEPRMSAKRTVTSVLLPEPAARPISFQRDVWEHSCLARVPRELWLSRLLRSDLWFDRKFCKTWIHDGSVHHSGTDRFEPHSAVVAKDRIRQILTLTLRAKHNGNQSQLGCVVANSIKPG
jgi:hypothetical protein